MSCFLSLTQRALVQGADSNKLQLGGAWWTVTLCLLACSKDTHIDYYTIHLIYMFVQVFKLLMLQELVAWHFVLQAHKTHQLKWFNMLHVPLRFEFVKQMFGVISYPHSSWCVFTLVMCVPKVNLTPLRELVAWHFVLQAHKTHQLKWFNMLHVPLKFECVKPMFGATHILVDVYSP